MEMRVIKFSIIILLIVMLISDCGADKCSYENCPTWKTDMLNVHLICHSHDDAGWLKTVDQYFWGSNQGEDRAGVQYILDSMTKELNHDPNKKFTYAETSFLYRWMLTKDDATRHSIINLVRNGQLEFTNGGWVQNDEAATHYAAIIDQMTTGHQFLNSTFGRCGVPKTGWQIDPFGHSREAASLFAQMGLESLFFARIHYTDANYRRSDKSMEMLWSGSDDLGESSDIFTHVFYNHYGPPPGFCFDENCGDEPIMDDPRLEEYNVDKRVDQFLAYVQKQANSYQTNHILVTMGDDFQYMNAGQVYVNLDKLIKHVNERQSNGTKVNVFYSTPSCYTKAVKEAGIQLTTKTDDFFPYANSEHAYWTGYFTSRPAVKDDVRQASNMLLACQAMDAVGYLGPSDFGDVDVLHQSLGLLQHHDAITGTEKQVVTYDYQKLLHEGFLQCQQVFNDALTKIAPKPTVTQTPPYHTFCFNLNASACNVSQEENQFIVTIYNSMSLPLNTFLRLPVSASNYAISDPTGQSISPQITKTFITNQLSDEQGPYDLFIPISVPGIGYSTYYISRQPSLSKMVLCQGITREDNVYIRRIYGIDCNVPSVQLGSINERSDPDTISNEFLSVEFDSNTGLIKSITDLTSRNTLSLKQNFYWYKGSTQGQKSGAYVFRPDGTKPYDVASGTVNMEKIEGTLVQEMRQTFANWLTQTVRLYHGKPYLEFEWTVGPIPFGDHVTKEIITRFDTPISNDKIFWTDSNGRQMMKRTRNYQPTYQYSDTEPISGNYYPVNSRISIQDTNTQLTILTDRSQGGSSITDGSIEIMIHRRCAMDDGFGVGEPLNEPGTDGRGLVVRGKHWLLLSEPSKAAKLHRQFAMEMFHQPILTFAPISTSFEDYRKQFYTMNTAISSPMPQNANFLTVAQWQGTTILLRLEHLYQKNEDPELSKPVSILIKDHLSAFDILSMEELALSGNSLNSTSSHQLPIDEPITLQPMQIRTFRCEVRDKTILG